MKAEEYRKVIGNRVRTFRESRGWSQSSLAKYVGCGQSQISRLEDGDAPLDHDVMLSIADALGIPALDLLPPLVRTEPTGADKPDLTATLCALHPDYDAGTVRSISNIAEALYREDLRKRKEKS